MNDLHMSLAKSRSSGLLNLVYTSKFLLFCVLFTNDNVSSRYFCRENLFAFFCSEQTLLKHLCGVLCRYLKQAMTRSEEDFKTWVLGHPGQVVLTVVSRKIIEIKQGE